MSVKDHEAFCFDGFQDGLLFWDDFAGDQIQDEWRIGLVGTGSGIVVDQQTGGIVRLRCTTNAGGDLVYLDWADIRSLHVDKKISMEVRAKISATTTMSAHLQLRFDANNLIRFFYDTSSAHVTWHIACVNGGIPTDLDSGVAPDTNYHVFRIETGHTDGVHFYIDPPTECANSPINTNIPDGATDFLQPYFFTRPFAIVTRDLDIDYVYLRQDR